ENAPEIAKVLVYCQQVLGHLCEKFSSLPEVPKWDLTPFKTIEGFLTVVSEGKLEIFGLPDRARRVHNLLRAIIRGEHYADFEATIKEFPDAPLATRLGHSRTHALFQDVLREPFGCNNIGG
ncbi:unnamed protein product, partial [Symbiodinium sp. CCMP2592]